MPRFCANLGFLFTEVEFEQRFERAARAGFRGVEYMSPYEYPAERLQTLLAGSALTQVLFNLPAGDWAAGERGIACLPGREAEFRAGVAQGIDYALALGCRQLNCLAGLTPAGVPEAQIPKRSRPTCAMPQESWPCTISVCSLSRSTAESICRVFGWIRRQRR